MNLLGQKIKSECESFDLKDFFVRFFFYTCFFLCTVLIRMHGRVCFCSVCVPHNSTASPGSVHSIYATFDSSNDARQHADVLVATAIQ